MPTIRNVYFSGLDDYASDSATEHWTVVLTAREPYGEHTASKAPLVPQKGSRYAGNSSWLCDSISVRDVGGGVYDVACRFSPPPPINLEQPQPDGNGEIAPTDEPAAVQWTQVASAEYVDVSVNGYPITNSSGEPLDPPLTRDFYDLLLTVRRKETTSFFNFDRAMNYSGAAVNNDAFAGFRPGQCRMNSITAVKYWRSGYGHYYDVEYKIQCRQPVPPGKTSGGQQLGDFDRHGLAWQHRYLDRGYRTIEGYDANSKPIYRNVRDEDGNPITSPVLLDGEGQILGEGQEPVWIYRMKYAYLPFSVFNLPTE
jgi:hypothetical protein